MRTTTALSIVLLLAAGCVVRTASSPPPSGPVGSGPPPSQPPPSQPTPSQPPPVVQPAPPPTQPAPPPSPPPVVQPAPPPGPPAHAGDKWSDRQFDKRSDWDKLGERWVEGRMDRDKIQVGKGDGKFVALAVVVESSSIEMYDMVVTFGDGSTWSPSLRWVFGQGTTSRVIDLPGDARWIKKVEFRYGNLPGGGKAQVELWGLDARRDSHDGKDDKGHGHGHGKGHDKGRGKGHDHH
ncbi:MAG TPA: hypothetical protein VM261_22315 [Kofleriaceae bacterium]|nr:hypothetical protein [Kofleriaceae bacterium]